MSAEPARPGPIDCLQRGLRSLRANWQLVPLLAVQTVLTVALALAGFLMLLTGLGVSVVAWLRGLGPDWPRQLADDLVAALETAPPPLMSLLTPLLAATLAWTLAFGLYCYLQGGVVGVLAKAEMAVGSGRPGWRAFRAFSGARFDRQGRRLFWRYFWLNHLVGAVALGWALVAVLLVGAALALADRIAPAAGVTLGCSGLVPLGLLAVAVAIWSLLVTVEAARPRAGGVLAAGRRAVGTLRRRFAAVLLLVFLAFLAWLWVGSVFLPLGWGLDLAAGDHRLLGLGAQGVLMAFEALADCALLVALLAALTTLVAGEGPAAVETGR